MDKERKYAVYAAGGVEPVRWVSTGERDDLLRCGAATPFGRRGRCLRLRQDGPGYGMSVTMGPGVVLAHAAGDPRARMAVLAWRRT